VSADGLRWGVEPICSVLSEHGLKIAPSTYYAARKRPLSSVAQRHAQLLPEVVRVQTSRDLGRGVYGARKVWKQLLREDVNIGRGQVETLMRTAGLKGIRRGKQFVTTRSDKTGTRPPDLVDRDFTANCPNMLWVVDI
jgi:putative transposase